MSPANFLLRLKPRALGFVIFALVFGGSSVALSFLYFQTVRQRKADMRQYALELARTAAPLVDVNLHERLVRPEQLHAEEYRRALAPLVQYHHLHPSMQYLWTVRVLPNDDQLFMLCTSTDPGIRRQQEELGRRQVEIPFLGPNTETERGRQTIATLRAGRPYVFPDVYTDEHDSYLEARVPLVDAAGRFIGYLGVDYSLDSYEKAIDEVRFTGFVTLGLALGLGLLLGRIASVLRRRDRETREEIEQQRDLARKANEAKSELLGIAAHDLKNPLSAIAGMSGLLAKMMQARPDQAAIKADLEVIQTIHGSAQHMSDIVLGILSSEGLEHGNLPFHPVDTDLSALVEKITQFNRPAAEKKKISVQLAVPPGLTARVDAKLLREAFDNYVSNAVKYSPPGRAVTVALGRLADGALEFSVQDQGPGLTPEDHAKLFGKFQKLTPRPTGGESSTGLGLSIVKTIAELHGGSVGCDTAPGAGARFWLRLPAGAPKAAG
jgi:signal transduction histidine kinase